MQNTLYSVFFSVKFTLNVALQVALYSTFKVMYRQTHKSCHRKQYYANSFSPLHLIMHSQFVVSLCLNVFDSYLVYITMAIYARGAHLYTALRM